MRDTALNSGVEHIDEKIIGVNLDENTGDIRSLVLNGNDKIEGDLFIDCTGFKGLLIQEALNTGYEDWSQWLFCDRAVAVQSELVGVPIPRTIAKAHTAGWQWKIPLRHRQGNGHVYSSQFMDDAKAQDILLAHIDGKVLHEPRKFNFVAGRRKLAWNKNCIAVGLAAGFLEPLESTSIALIETAIEKICGSFPFPYIDIKNVNRFNEITATEYERVRDFIILHYKANQRDDNDFWVQCRALVLPDTLQQKIDAYLARGEMLHYSWEMFHPDSWLAIYSGFQWLPQKYDARVDNVELDYIKRSLADMRKSVASAVEAIAPYEQFMAENFEGVGV
jgi:tryptophan halogenase